MSILDTDVLSEIQFDMLEPTQDGGVTWTSGMWSATEVLAYLNQRQDRFLKESLLLVAWTTLAVTANQRTVNMPVDWVATQRISWQGNSPPLAPGAATYVKLPLSDTWEADNGFPTWRTASASRPQIAMDSSLQTLTLLLAPPPLGVGTLSLYYVSTAEPLLGTGTTFTVPDEFVPYIKWGAMADMLIKVGRIQDADRASYCEQRFEEGVALAKSWIQGAF